MDDRQLEKYRLAFEISPVPLLLVSSDGQIVMVNAGLNELFGYDADELAGQSVEVLIPDSVKKYHPQLRNAYFRVPTKRGMGVGRDLYGKTRIGNVIPLELALEPVPIGDDTWAMVAAVDIRQRKAQEERLRQAMDASASAMVMVDSSGNIIFANKSSFELFGYEETELVGSTIERLVPKSARRAHPVYRSSFMSASVARPMGQDQALFACHRDGREFPVEIALTPVDTSDDNKMVMSTIIDLSDRVEAERTLAKKAHQLESLNVELSHFAYSASHDLKAPLTTIVGLLNICIEDLEDGNLDELRSNLERAVKIGQRSSEKVESVLRVARSAHDGGSPERIGLRELIQDIWEDLCAAGDSSNQELTLNLDSVERISTDRAALQIILENLLSNAVRFRDANKGKLNVIIDADRSDSSIHIGVSDNGVGIPTDSQHLVFDMFKRLDDRSGDGLGLALVKKQVERLGGSVSVESREGHGTQIKLTIPNMSESDQ